jgi:replicative DNA helicase
MSTTQNDSLPPEAENTKSGLPHSIDAERAVIGAVLIEPRLYADELHDILKADDFFIHRLRFIWEAVDTLYTSAMAIDVLTISERLDDMGRLDEIGGMAFLTSLLNECPTTLHAESYAKIVKEMSLRRKLLLICNDVANQAYGQTPPGEIIEKVSQKFETMLADGMDGWHGISDAKQSVTSADKRAEKNSLPTVRKITTGFIDLDKLLKRWGQSNFYIVAGRPGAGKTAFMLSAMLDLMKRGFKPLFFSLEMSKEQLEYRLLAMLTGIPSDRIADGELGDDEWPLYYAAVERLRDMPHWIDDTPALTASQLRTKARYAVQRYGIDIIFLDYVQLMFSEVRTNSREQEVAKISRACKNVARETDLPLVAGCQMSRAIESRSEKEPVLSDLRESGALEQDSDVVMFLYRDEKAAMANVTHLKVAKHRNGAVGSVDLIFRNNLTKFENAISRRVS